MLQRDTRKPVAVARPSEPKSHPLRVAGALFVVLCMAGLFFVVRPKPGGYIDAGNAAQALLDFREAVPPSATAERIGQITSAAGPADVLQVLGASEDDASAAVAALRQTGLINLKRLRPGTALTAHFDEAANDGAGRLLAVSLKADARQTLLATRKADDTFLASVLTARLATSYQRVAGTIESSLENAITELGGKPEHARQFAALFPEDPALLRGGRKGERFDLIYEIAVDERGNPIEAGDVVFAAFNGYRASGSWYRHSPSDTDLAEFYDSNGVARQRFLTRFPIGRTQINSGFGQRLHPVTGQLHFHSGVDFKSPEGTPIYAAGNGVVRSMSSQSGYGNIVVVDHIRDFQTLYAHMSRFAETLKPGTQVRRGDLIGYVGETGTATGPHLHFEIRQKGRLLNPMTVELPSGRDLSSQPELYAEFLVRRNEIDRMRGATLPMLTASRAATGYGAPP